MGQIFKGKENKFYASDFTRDELARLPWQLNMYVTNVRRDERFQNLKNLCQLSVMLVETNKHEQYHTSSVP